MSMFCYQCQEANQNEGCSISGVCGKGPGTANLMDLLVFNLKGVAVLEERASLGRPGPWVRATLEDAGQARRVDLVATDYAPITRMPADGRTCYLTLGFPF